VPKKMGGGKRQGTGAPGESETRGSARSIVSAVGTSDHVWRPCCALQRRRMVNGKHPTLERRQVEEVRQHGSLRPELFLRQFGARCAILVSMRSRAARITVALILLICVVCPVVEMFDQWDNTIQTGNDTEYALVVLALCVGAAYSFARFVLRIIARSRSNRAAASDSCLTTFSWGLLHLIVKASISASPPLTTLRI
jgi:hypothetical protein